MMHTKTAGPGSFSGFDLLSVPSPCFVTDLARLEDNLRLLNAVTEASGAHILTALKAFSLWSTAPLVSRYLAGACASGLYEARLARAHYSGLLSCFAPAYKTDEMDELQACAIILFSTRRNRSAGLQVRQLHKEQNLVCG